MPYYAQGTSHYLKERFKSSKKAIFRSKMPYIHRTISSDFLSYLTDK